MSNYLNFFDSILQIDTLLGVFENLKHRFDRQTLNIGVVGQMRQGKSTLLQKLSGLTDAEIPAQKGGACTAVRSIVYHHDGDTRVDVTHRDSILIPSCARLYSEVEAQLTLARKVFGELQEDEAWAEKVEAIFDDLWEDLRLGMHEPSEAVFAIAEEFVDGLLWSKDIKRQYKFFVQRNRSNIWAEEFKPNDSKLEWKKLVDAAMDANQPQKINRN